MAQITRYDGNLKPFADDAIGTERTIFGAETQDDTLDANINADFLRGWGIVGVNQLPTKQDFNAFAYTSTALTSYLFQMGVPEWNTSQEYFTGSITNVAGVLYRAIQDNTGVNPTTDNGANWTTVGNELLDEDDFASDSDTKGATQQSIKAYVDGQQDQIMYIEHQETSGTNPSTAGSTSFVKGNLNTVLINEIAGASLVSNEAVLPAGTYEITGRVPMHTGSENTFQGRPRLYNRTDTLTIKEGDSMQVSDSTTPYMEVYDKITLTSTKNISLDYRFNNSNIRAGTAGGQGTVESYASMKIRKVA